MKPNGLYVRTDSAYQPLDDLVNDIKARPGQVQIGIAASTYFHTFPAAMLDKLGLDAQLIDAGIDNERTLSLVGGHIDVIATQYSNSITPYIDSGDVKCLAIAQDDFSYPGQLYMFLASGGVDPKILDKLNGAMCAVLENPDFQKDFAKFGVDLYPPMDAKETHDKMYELRDIFLESCDLIK
jgi:tripartite-type tricarboxylate transporter receptor subunit TctC